MEDLEVDQISQAEFYVIFLEVLSSLKLESAKSKTLFFGSDFSEDSKEEFFVSFLDEDMISEDFINQSDAVVDKDGNYFSSCYPTFPLWKHAADALLLWIETGECVVTHKPMNYLEEMQRYNETEVNRSVKAIRKAWVISYSEERKSLLKKLLLDLGISGTLKLLNLRHTVATALMCPPSLQNCLASFRVLHHPKSPLTAGGRAHSKHCVRDKSKSWWGLSTGTIANKNETAENVLRKILQNVAWLNIHIIGGNTKILEVRTSEGYGARWSADGHHFRGFVEPPMEDGFATGWVH